MMCNWAYNAAMPFSWVLIITAHNRDFLLDRITSLPGHYEPGTWDNESIVADTWTRETQDVIGCIFIFIA